LTIDADFGRKQISGLANAAKPDEIVAEWNASATHPKLAQEKIGEMKVKNSTCRDKPLICFRAKQ
jgi:hypothetical protein